MVVSEERMAALEARTERLETRMRRLDARLAGGVEPRVARGVEPRVPGGLARAAGVAARHPAPPAPGLEAPRAATPATPLSTPSLKTQTMAEPAARLVAPAGASAPRLEDFVGGRMLGWVGGIAILVGLLFLLVIAASRGWIGEEARVLMAAVTSVALLVAGAWLHERRGRNEAALAAAATGIAGLFATTVVAGPVYDLLPSSAALVFALLVGAVATGLALRWEAPGIGWLGIAGALLSPALVGAGGDGSGIALMLVAYAAAGAVMVWQRWHALAGVAFAIAVPQLAWWMIGADLLAPDAPPTFTVVAALVVFGAVTAVGAVGFEWRMCAAHVRISALVLLAMNALALAGLGSVALGETGTSLWLAALAFGHLAAGLLARRSTRVSRELALMLSGLGIVLADVAFASVTSGLPLVLGWAAGAVGFSVLARTARHRADEAVALSGLGGHLLLAVATALSSAAETVPEEHAAAVAALATVAAGAWAAARIVAPRLPVWRLLLDVAALGALALLSAYALEGMALTLAFAGEAAALAALAVRDRGRARRDDDGAARASDSVDDRDRAIERIDDRDGAIEPIDDRDRAIDPLLFPAAVAFLGLALAHTIAVLAPPSVLVAGLDPVPTAAAPLAAVAVAAALVARAASRNVERIALGGTAAVVGLHLVSALVVTPFQPGGDATGLPLEQLDVRQQGQALLSALWALAGVAALVAGLVRDSRALRLAALALLTLTAGKVFVFDLASLTSLYRVASCVALGLLLLVGAFAWQRIRPRPLPDFREVPGALR
jgi:uncharacterized membrane protein